MDELLPPTPRTVSERDADEPTESSSAIMFWVLVALVFSAFAPCVIVPVLQDYRALKVLERVESEAIRQMRTEVARQHRHLEALRKDPLVIARVAVRDLAYTRPNETTVFLAADTNHSRPEPTISLDGVAPPPVVARFLSWLPFSDRTDVFAQPASRQTIMVLSGVVVLTAFALYPPRRQRPTPPA